MTTKIPCLAILLGSILSAQAALNITDDVAAPSINLLAGGIQGSQNAGTRNRYYDQNNAESGADYGQFFTLGTLDPGTTLDAITIQAHFDVGSDALNQLYHAQVWSVSGGAVGTLLADASGTMPSTFAGLDYLRLDFTAEDEISLTSDTQYAFVVFFDERGTDTGSHATRRSFQIGKQDGGSYTGGDMFRREFNGFNTPTASRPVDSTGFDYANATDGNADMVFYIQGIPEPASAMMLALGSLGLLSVRRRRAV